MSDILIVEFYGDATKPFASVLVWHGGDNPVSASLTLTAFLMGLEDKIKSRHMDAGELASRFLVSQTEYDSEKRSHILDAVLIAPAFEYGYQLCRLYGVGKDLKVVVVLDSYTTDEEIEDAREIWKMVPYPCEFMESTGRKLTEFSY